MIDGAIMVGIGALVLLLGFKVIEFPSSAQFDAKAWHAKHGLKFRVMGVLLVVIGAILAFAGTAGGS